jgi:transposase-like protein
MTETIIEERPATRHDQWRERVAEQERSGLSVKQFCKEHGLAECSFYAWRKRLRKQQGPVRFALVEREAVTRQESVREARLELVLASGARLRIGAGVDSTTLRTVLEALRA